ncbi:NAD(P)-binding protein [Aspergillus keveii]|uniref:NAD(P)-binding protein n=1 Tax=Aspergillus keveii TaxID=714993 RepID=A0ABR4FYL0_9EURO
MPATPRRTVLITGCSAGGAGSALATTFASQGLHVFATARNTSKMTQLSDIKNITLLHLDVEDPTSITAAVEAVREHTGGTLDYLVNNAGMSRVRPALDTDLEQARKVFEVNYWGVVSVTHAFAPMVIAAKGCFVNVSSLAGVVLAPWIAFYASSKAAVKAYSEALRLEMAPLGVKVITVMSGVVHTNIFVNNPEPDLPDDSMWKGAQKEVRYNAAGTAQSPMGVSPEEFAKGAVESVLGGSNGQVFKGGMAGFG